jgi:hypothetical protein
VSTPREPQVEVLCHLTPTSLLTSADGLRQIFPFLEEAFAYFDSIPRGTVQSLNALNNRIIPFFLRADRYPEVADLLIDNDFEIRLASYLGTAESLDEVNTILMALACFFQHFPTYLPPEFLTQLFTFFQQFDPDALPPTSETLLEYILLIISTGLTTEFCSIFPETFFSAMLGFCGKSPKLDKVIAGIAVQAAPMIQNWPVAHGFVVTFLKGFFDLNISDELSKLLFVLAGQNSELFADEAVITVFLNLRRFTAVHVFLFKTIRRIQNPEILFQRLLDEETAGVLRDAFQDPASAPDALKTIRHLLTVDPSQTHSMFLDRVESPHYIIPELFTLVRDSTFQVQQEAIDLLLQALQYCPEAFWGHMRTDLRPICYAIGIALELNEDTQFIALATILELVGMCETENIPLLDIVNESEIPAQVKELVNSENEEVRDTALQIYATLFSDE